ncbi:MAG: tetratricopeptide repeat protein, partial [Planctomycetia bacterium]|nr:tetratricopeptide repeat protein [Planctomycetia bacterium]
DRMAVAAYGATAFCDGLTQAIRRSIELDWALGKTIDDLIRTRRAVTQFYRSAPLPDLSEREQLETVLAEVIARPTDANDSHPSPKDRFRLAAALDPRTAPVPEEFVSRLIEADAKMAAELGTSLDEKITARAKAVLHELDEGITMLSQIINRNDHPDARYERARLLMDMGDYAGVVKDLDVLLKLAPDAGPIRYMRARAYEKLGRYAEAIADLELVTKSLDEEQAAPGSPDALETEQVRNQVMLRTAQCLASAERLPEASAMYDRVLTKTPKSLAALIGRGRVAIGMKAAAKALADFTSAVTHWPTSAEALLERAELYARCGRAEQATADQQAAAAIDRRVAEERKKQQAKPQAAAPQQTAPQPQKPATNGQPAAAQKTAAPQPAKPHIGPPAVSQAGPHLVTAPKSKDPNPNPAIGRRE